jgi:hypothetical protein
MVNGEWWMVLYNWALALLDIQKLNKLNETEQ